MILFLMTMNTFNFTLSYAKRYIHKAFEYKQKLGDFSRKFQNRHPFYYADVSTTHKIGHFYSTWAFSSSSYEDFIHHYLLKFSPLNHWFFKANSTNHHHGPEGSVLGIPIQDKAF